MITTQAERNAVQAATKPRTQADKPNLQAQAIRKLQAQARRMGPWMAPRFLRNRGYSFTAAHVILFGRLPRF